MNGPEIVFFKALHLYTGELDTSKYGPKLCLKQ